MKENTELTNRLDGMSQQPSAAQELPERTAVVGYSLVKDLDEGNLEHTEVRYQWDARITDAMTKVKNLTGDFHHIVLVVGGNDCHGIDRPSATDIVSSYGRLVDTAKEKAHISDSSKHTTTYCVG